MDYMGMFYVCTFTRTHRPFSFALQRVNGGEREVLNIDTKVNQKQSLFQASHAL